MARITTVHQSNFPYHVAGRCINQDWFKIPMIDVWEIFSEQLHFIRHAYNIRILAFVLMNNHYHLLVRTPDANLAEGMGWFNRECSRTLTRHGNRINQTYGARYFRCLIATNHYYLNAYKYIYRNPVTAGVCDSVESYPFSSLNGLLGGSKLTIPIEEDLTLFDDVEGTLNWLNQAPSLENWEAVRKALRRREFRLGKVNRKPHPLEVDTL